MEDIDVCTNSASIYCNEPRYGYGPIFMRRGEGYEEAVSYLCYFYVIWEKLEKLAIQARLTTPDTATLKNWQIKAGTIQDVRRQTVFEALHQLTLDASAPRGAL